MLLKIRNKSLRCDSDESSLLGRAVISHYYQNSGIFLGIHHFLKITQEMEGKENNLKCAHLLYVCRVFLYKVLRSLCEVYKILRLKMHENTKLVSTLKCHCLPQIRGVG